MTRDCLSSGLICSGLEWSIIRKFYCHYIYGFNSFSSTLTPSMRLLLAQSWQQRLCLLTNKMFLKGKLNWCRMNFKFQLFLMVDDNLKYFPLHSKTVEPFLFRAQQIAYPDGGWQFDGSKHLLTALYNGKEFHLCRSYTFIVKSEQD